MRLADILVLGLLLSVIALDLLRGVQGSPFPVLAAGTAAIAWFILVRRRGERAPGPTPPSPAVLIPTKDNIGTIADVVRRACTQGLPVFVVDDGCVDGSGDAARAAGATVITHPVNRGKGAALLTGMRAAAKLGYTHVICLDADGQHDPADIPAFAAAIAAEPVAIFAGVRDLSTAPEISRFGRKFSNFWIRVETGWRVADSQCGFRAYPIAPVLDLGLGGGRYEMEVEVLTRSLWAGVPVRDLPCNVYYPPKEERVSSFRPFKDNARITWINILLIAERILWPPRWILRMRAAAAWDGRSRGTGAGWRLVLWLKRLLGQRFAYAIGTGLAAWYVAFAPQARAGLEPYRTRTLPNRSSFVASFLIFRSFAHAVLDRLTFAESGPAAFRYVREGQEHLLGAFTEPQGAILLSAHLGNIEVSAGPGGNAERVKKLHVLRFEAPGDHGRAILASMPEQWRPRIIAVNASEGFSALTVVRALREGAVVAMMGDRLIDERGVTVNFLGSPARFPAGPWMLAALARVPVIIVGAFQEGAGTYRVLALPPIRCSFDRKRTREEQLQEWAQTYADRLGDLARRYPTQYYNFYDVWAPPPAEASGEQSGAG
jgi:predicted LPLAT superfamily acyltransferase